MKQALLIFLVLLFTSHTDAQFCNESGNVIVFANYDGGILNINVDEDIPNLKIGICSYEAATITISGTYASNVTEVIYAGFNSYNSNCSGNDIENTTISGVPAGIVSILFAPPVTLSDPDGNGSIICAYSCEEGNQGGCNTAAQVVDYFVETFNGNLYFYYTLYSCWSPAAHNVSAGGNCCETDPLAPVAAFTPSSSDICVGDCIDFTNQSSNIPDTFEWTFNGAATATSEVFAPQDICYNNEGSFEVSLTVTNENGSHTVTQSINVGACEVPGCTYEQAENYDPLATVDDHSCIFDCEGGCEGDFDDDGIISVSDLIMFIGLYGSICPE